MTPPARKLIGRNSGAMSRQRVYETADGIEVESHEGYEVTRKRVLFQEVLLVTIHRESGRAFVISTGLATLFFILMALILQVTSPAAAITFALLAVPFLIACLVRLILKHDYVTVFGRRSKAAMRFMRKRRAREVYGRICSRTTEVQRAATPAASFGPGPAND
jgi:hypothetical protein